MLNIHVPADELFQQYSKHQHGQAGMVDIHTVLENEQIKQVIDGGCKLWSLTPGSLVALLDFEVLEDCSSITPLENFFSIEILLRGSTEICLGDHSLSNNGVPRIYLASHGKCSKKRRVHQKGDSLRSIGIWISPELFLQDFGVDVSTLPDDVQYALIHPDSGVVSFPVTSKIKQIANDIFDMSYEGMMAEQYLKAKFTELLCLIIELAGSETSKVADQLTLKRNKSRTLKKILQALDQSRYLSLSMGALANELGLCQSTLSSVFKEGYGMKLSEYLMQRRMEAARRLLQEGSLSVLEVALEVGYDNQSSFGRAYRKFYNCTPREDLGYP